MMVGHTVGDRVVFLTRDRALDYGYAPSEVFAATGRIYIAHDPLDEKLYQNFRDASDLSCVLQTDPRFFVELDKLPQKHLDSDIVILTRKKFIESQGFLYSLLFYAEEGQLEPFAYPRRTLSLVGLLPGRKYEVVNRTHDSRGVEVKGVPGIYYSAIFDSFPAKRLGRSRRGQEADGQEGKDCHKCFRRSQ